MRRASGWKNWIQYLTGTLIVIYAFTLPISTTVTDNLFPFIALLCLFARSSDGSLIQRLFSQPVVLTYVLFFILLLLNAWHSPGTPHDIWHSLFKYSSFLSAACIMISFNNDRWRRYAMNAFLGAMMLTLLLSYLKYYWIHDLFHTRFDQASVFKDHIIQNFLMAITFFILFYRWQSKQPHRWLSALLIPFVLYNILFISQGRSGYFIFAALLFYTLAIYLGWRGLLIAFAALSVLSVLAYSLAPEFNSRVRAIGNDLDQYRQGKIVSSMGIRIQSVKNAYALIKKKPWIGYGTGSFQAIYATLPVDVTKDTGIMKTAYNNYLNIAVEMGLLGLAFIILIFWVSWRYSQFLNPEWRYYTRILLISMGLGCMANAWLSDITELHLFTFFLGLGFANLPAQLALKTQAASKSESQSHSFNGAN